MSLGEQIAMAGLMERAMRGQGEDDEERGGRFERAGDQLIVGR